MHQKNVLGDLIEVLSYQKERFQVIENVHYFFLILSTRDLSARRTKVQNQADSLKQSILTQKTNTMEKCITSRIKKKHIMPTFFFVNFVFYVISKNAILHSNLMWSSETCLRPLVRTDVAVDTFQRSR